MAPTLPRLTSGAALSSSSSSSPSAGSKLKVITLSSSPSDDEQEASSWKSSLSAGPKHNIITVSSDDDEQEASSWKRSSSAGSKDGPVVLTSSDSDSDGVLLANCRKRRPPCNVAWVFSDEVNILTVLADERLESRRLPGSPSALLEAISRRVNLRRQNPTAGDVAKKVHNLRERFKKVIASGGPSGELRDRKLYDLSVKGIRCELAKSGLQSIVAENQTPANILQKKIEAPNGLIHGETVEVTSKYYCAVPHNVPTNNPKMQGVMLPPFNALPSMPWKVVKKSPTPRRVKGRKNKNDITTSLECYMEEHGTTGKEVAAALLTMVDSSWRRMNKALMEIDRALLPAVNVAAINQASVIEVVYYGGNDGYTFTGDIEGVVTSLFLKPIPQFKC